MIIHFPLLLLAALLIWFQRQWMRLAHAFSNRRRRREGEGAASPEPWKAREPGDPRLPFGEFLKFRNYVDMVRAAAGSLALSGGMTIPVSILPAAGASKAQVWQVIIIRASILLFGLLVQTLRFERGKISFSPPVFYLAGLSVGLCDIRGAA